jgi:DNA polymerase/3'-5' exonuclease PolX
LSSCFGNSPRTSLRGGNPYRAKAYARAADSLAALVVPLDQIIALTEIPGIGDAIADIVTKLHRTVTHPGLEAMRKEIPASVLEMLAVPGLRPDKVLKLYKELGIISLAGLEQAARGPPQGRERARRRAAGEDSAEPRDPAQRRRTPPHAPGCILGNLAR